MLVKLCVYFFFHLLECFIQVHLTWCPWNVFQPEKRLWRGTDPQGRDFSHQTGGGVFLSISSQPLLTKAKSPPFTLLPFFFFLNKTFYRNGNPLQCSCLENPRDGGARWAAVYGVSQSQTRLTRLSSSSYDMTNFWNPHFLNELNCYLFSCRCDS